jgi:hypothetical protein
VYFDGVVGDLRSVFIDQTTPGNDFIYLSVTQDDGKEWLTEFYPEPVTNRNVLESMVGKKVRVYGVYEGLSIDYKKPVVSLYNYSTCKIELFDNNKVFTLKELSNDVDTMVAWCNDNVSEMCVDDYVVQSNQAKFGITGGVIDSVSVNDSKFVIFTKSSDSLSRYEFDTSAPYLSNKPVNLGNLQYGDCVKVYYWIGFDNIPCVFAVKKVSDCGITKQEIYSLFSKEYKEYTYEEMARNPEKVKGSKAMFSGQVIQVIEHDDIVDLRVNISNIGGGFNTDTVYVVYTRKSPDEDRILEKDNVTIYGTLDGLYTYDAVSGAKITLPLIFADYIDVEL